MLAIFKPTFSVGLISLNSFANIPSMAFSPCFLCDARCCKDYAITVTSFDVIIIAQDLNTSPSDFAMLSKAALLNADPSTSLECAADGKIISYVLTLKGQPCVFLSNNRCKIHDFAPLVCRLYPYRIDGSFMKSARCFLPSKCLYFLSKPNKEIVEQFSHNLSAYKKLVTEWNIKHKGGTKEQCFEFLLRRTKEIIAFKG